jgi:hypothetical protein
MFAIKCRVAGKTPMGRDRHGLTLYPAQQQPDDSGFFGGIVAGSLTFEVNTETADHFDINDEVDVQITPAPEKPGRTPTRVADSATAPAPIRATHPAAPSQAAPSPTATPAPAVNAPTPVMTPRT